MLKQKILTRKTLPQILNKLKKAKKRIVFTNGCFDIIHYGHVVYLEKAKALGDVLIIGLNSDSSVKTIKGDKRPIVGEAQRARVLAALSCVDYVVIFNEPTPYDLIKVVSPAVLVKGGDWKVKDIAGADLVLKNNGKVAIIPYIKGFSTTSLINKIKEVYC